MCPGCLGYASGEDPDLTNLTLSVTHIEAGEAATSACCIPGQAIHCVACRANKGTPAAGTRFCGQHEHAVLSCGQRTQLLHRGCGRWFFNVPWSSEHSNVCTQRCQAKVGTGYAGRPIPLM
jgi:hypothetical protein